MAQAENTSIFSKSYCLAYYKLESGALTVDSKNGYTLTNNNSVAEVTGKYGGGADFGVSASGKWLSVASALGVSGQTFAVSAWVKSTQALNDEEENWIWKFDNAGAGSFFLRFYKPTGTTVEVNLVRNNGLTQEWIRYAWDFGQTNWHHYVCNINNNSMELFVDGVSRGSTACSTTTNGSSTGFQIGATNMDGYIDDVVVASQILTAGEIQELYANSQYITKTLKYCVKTTPITLTKSLKYAVQLSPAQITKSVKYAVKTTQSTIQKSLTYKCNVYHPFIYETQKTIYVDKY